MYSSTGTASATSVVSTTAYCSESESLKSRSSNRETQHYTIHEKVIGKKGVPSLEFVNPGSKFSFEVQGKRRVKPRTQYSDSRNKPLYNEKGILVESNQDICDCLRRDCPGCHFPCKQCKSTKCGNKCRVHRHWYYEKIEIEGLSKTLEMHLSST